eukprot:TRINITY_DN9793_c0_g2_i1.p1 TRINITY_DN9793_c0_g2~~TRINITY_DN9793_c0_g2_i1.p1  ORF type:complete len:166 (+),score=32.68 TRINITY_DN9793_c0_g2_i1:58-555(+)
MTSIYFEESLITHGNLRFLVTKGPSRDHIKPYLKLLQEYNVSDVVRACEPTYPASYLEEHEIKVHDWDFPDGKAPPKSICVRWLQLVSETFSSDSVDGKKKAIALHCVAGLGRAPLLVGIALIKLGSLAPSEAIDLIRSKRKGALNANQLTFLRTIKKKKNCTLM